jgi:hypothetical protein
MKTLYFPFQDDIKDDTSMPANRERYRKKYGASLRVVQYPGSLAEVGIEETLIVAGHGLPGSDKIGLSVDDPATPRTERWGRYVLGHRPRTMQLTLTADNLADRISAAGLKKAHKRIKLITCGGAGMGVVDTESVAWKDGTQDGNRTIDDLTSIKLKELKSADCLASVLAKAMAQPGRGFTQVIVRGYPGFVNCTELQKFLSIESSSGEGHSGVSTDSWTKVSTTYWAPKMANVPNSKIIDPATGEKAKFWFDSKGNRVSPI